MDANLMYSPLESVFEQTMKREGRTVTAYTSGNQFQAFMRRNDDGNNYEDRITLFYHVNAPVVQGSLVSYGNKIYILVNRETEENHLYYKSSGLACNGLISLNDGSIIGIPCYGSSMKDGLVESGNVLSVIDGNMEFITEANSLSRALKIGNSFNEYGRTWQIDNIYYKDGILHIVAKVAMDETPDKNLKVIIDGLAQETYNVGDTAQLTAVPYIYNSVTSGTFTWESTNPNVAIVDGEGNVNFIAGGSVSFKAYWVEENFTGTTNAIIVANDADAEIWTIAIKGGADLKIGYSRTYTFVAMLNGEETLLPGIGYEIIDQSVPINFYEEYFDADKNTLKLRVRADLYGETFTIRAYHTEKGIEARINIRLVSAI